MSSSQQNPDREEEETCSLATAFTPQNDEKENVKHETLSQIDLSRNISRLQWSSSTTRKNIDNNVLECPSLSQDVRPHSESPSCLFASCSASQMMLGHNPQNPHDPQDSSVSILRPIPQDLHDSLSTMMKYKTEYKSWSDPFSVRIVTFDHYSAAPISGLDPMCSTFRGSPVSRVPVIRVFGSTPKGELFDTLVLLIFFWKSKK